MNIGRKLILSLGLTLAFWVLFSWPLPQHLTRAIPSSSQNVEKGQMRAMMPGDHLQLLYHFWLWGDMVAGHTPWFRNVYEFNLGDDEASRRQGANFAPFSVLYAVMAQAANRALSWNLTGLFSLWMTVFFTWILVGRYTRNEWLGAAFATLSILVPFRWVNLLGGSPAGFGLAWVPAVFLGLDLAVRESRIGGGLLCGVGLLFARWCDAHVFFFSTMALPFWFVISLLNRDPAAPRRFGRLAVAMLFIVLLLIPAFLFNYHKTGKMVLSRMGAGRAMFEIVAFSPKADGFLSWGTEGTPSHVFVGYALLSLLVLGLLCLPFAVRAENVTARRPRATYLLLLLGLAGIACLSLGPHSFHDGALFMALRKLVPPYRMVRQPDKIFCLLPTFAAVAGAVATGLMWSLMKRRFSQYLVLAALTAALAFEFRAQVRPTLCVLDTEQAAYRAVALDAGARAQKALALILPLWPGDSSWSSLYEHYVSLYRIRMINGYSPVPTRDYIAHVVLPLESVNQGILSDEQIQNLTDMGAQYILLHENAFPEKVSPFAVGLTLQRLLNHPRLVLLHHAESVWAFRIAPGPIERTVKKPDWRLIFPARRWELEKGEHQDVETVEDPACGGGAYVRLERPRSWVDAKSAEVGATPNLRWLIRVRGQGRLVTHTVRTGYGGGVTSVQTNVSAAGWEWLEVPLPRITGCPRVALRIELAGGVVDADLAVLAAGEWPALQPGATLEIPAAEFFHGGYTDLQDESVVLRTAYDPEAIIVYGPKLPLPPGTYRFSLYHDSGAAPGTELGRFNVRQREDDERGWVPVLAGETAHGFHVQEANLPVHLAFVFNRNADMRVRKIVITRVR